MTCFENNWIKLNKNNTYLAHEVYCRLGLVEGSGGHVNVEHHLPLAGADRLMETKPNLTASAQRVIVTLRAEKKKYNIKIVEKILIYFLCWRNDFCKWAGVQKWTSTDPPPLAVFWILSPLFLRFTQNPLFLSNIFYLKSSKKHSWCYFEQNLHPWLLERKWHNLTMYTGIIGKVSSKQSNFLPGEEWSSYRSISQGRQVSHHHVQCLIFKLIRGRFKKKF